MHRAGVVATADAPKSLAVGSEIVLDPFCAVDMHAATLADGRLAR
jgi:hypothetical protein